MNDGRPYNYVYATEARRCPSCDAGMLTVRGRAPIGSELWICEKCKRAWEVPKTQVAATEKPYPTDLVDVWMAPQ